MGESDLSLNVIDKIIGLLLVVGIVLAPWMLGTTTNTGVFVLNFINLLLGVCVLFKRILKIKKEDYGGGSRGCGNAKYIVVGSFSSASLFLAYVLVSAFNANSVIHYTYYPATHEATGVEIEYLNPITWLPHSYDKDLSLRAFWKYLSCACAFMAMREWLLGGSDWKKVYDQTDNQFPNLRMQIILWSISISTGALGFVGMLQRLDGTEKLLWIYDNHINGGQGAFGPFPYQSSGAQYLNLMWPVMLGFWWILRRQSISRTERGRRLGGEAHLMVLVLTVLAGTSVILTKSRGGALILLVLFSVVSILFLLGTIGFNGGKSTVLVVFLIMCGVGAWLGGKPLLDRFIYTDLREMSGRRLIYEDASRMADDFAVFGSGAETFAPLYFFYRNKDPIWNAYAHNDYLEGLITFGWVGLIIVFLNLLFVCLFPFFGDGIPAPAAFIVFIFLGLAGMLMHARFDLPFQIYSLHFEFVVLCAVLSCLQWKRT